MCRELGIVEQTFYRCRAKYSGMEVSEANRLNTLEFENNKLKKMVAELIMDPCELEGGIIKKLVKLGHCRELAKALMKSVWASKHHLQCLLLS
ncbi:MAG: transposase [Chromatiales bacterium]|nr:transposase [Chromatiales bacterium]